MPNEKRPTFSTEGKIGIALALVGLGGAGALYELPHPYSDYVGWSLIAFSIIGLILLSIYHLISRYLSRKKISKGDLLFVQKLEIRFKPSAPYETASISNGHMLSTVKIGLVATGGLSLSNCKIYVEKISPHPSFPGGFPMLLADQNFTIRHDDPERFVEIASHWDHAKQFRFSSPPGWWAETLNYIDDSTPYTIELRIKAKPEYEKSAIFRIWTDESKQLHMERL
jgi:hypothetical protein